jgi:membrane-associated protease RseP (regulator of RpoE activity)
MLGGPVMNLILALALTAVAYCGIGSMAPSLEIGQVLPCIGQNGQAIDCELASAQTSPAAISQLQVGDRIFMVEAQQVTSWQQFVEAKANWQANYDPNNPQTHYLGLTVLRAGALWTLSVMPLWLEDQNGEATSVIGIVAAEERVTGSLGDVPGIVWDQAVASAKLYARLPQSTWQAAVDTVSGRQRAADSPVSVVGVARLQGEVTANADQYVAAGSAWAARWSLWLSIGASLNLALFLFNLIPLLPLDGGHVLGALVEGIRRTGARLRRRMQRSSGEAATRPLPGPLDMARAVPLTYAVFGLLILLTVVLVVADLVNPVQV